VTKHAPPSRVRKLTAADIIRGCFGGKRRGHPDRYCLTGWAVTIFGPKWKSVTYALRDLCKRDYPKQIPPYHCSAVDLIIAVNDHRTVSKEELACIWNEAMHKLGYTEEFTFRGKPHFRRSENN